MNEDLASLASARQRHWLLMGREQTWSAERAERVLEITRRLNGGADDFGIHMSPEEGLYAKKRQERASGRAEDQEADRGRGEVS